MRVLMYLFVSANLMVARQTGSFHLAGPGGGGRRGDTSVCNLWHYNKKWKNETDSLITQGDSYHLIK